MYPVLRMVKGMALAALSFPLPLTGTHVSHHICWPWDLDIWMELNNGRSLTLYDLGRFPLTMRTGLAGMLRRRRWGMTMAGASVRWRRRVRVFDRVEMHSRCVGWDARFLYIEQSMWLRGEAASAALYRAVVTGPSGIVPTAEVLRALGMREATCTPPAYVQDWNRG
ncbi:MAG: thioeseterase [Alphaproteobacteria bacterium HGW-Alphaproteobacteria-2]|nr:MAG: thioeseterase [Alphaproteobacteria bacterium HGW-Alphaproteobacteria-2]